MNTPYHFCMLPERTSLLVQGIDARTFLQGLITQDIETVTEKHAAFSAMLNAQGKFLFDFFLLPEAHGVLIEIHTLFAARLKQLLSLYKLRANVIIEERTSSHSIAIMGDLSPLNLATTPGAIAPHNEAGILYTDPRTPLIGARLLTSHLPLAQEWLKSLGYDEIASSAYETQRIQLAIPEAGIDSIPEKTLILENGFEMLNGVSFTKGCYVGQEVTARTKHRANMQKGLYAISAERDLPTSGMEIVSHEKTVGELRSVSGNYGVALIRHDSANTVLTASGINLTASKPIWWGTFN